MNHHNDADDEVARLETHLGQQQQQQLGEKTPWNYVREEKKAQLLFQLGEVGGGHHHLLYRGDGGGEQVLHQLFGGQLLQQFGGEDNEQLLQL